ncbi:MAG: BrnT family toxin [Gemmatimonadota bacterium]|nr:BrnT family toxin [Gemmatimonadota bacterium]
MDIYYELHNITFVWDENKARTNSIKHDGVTFEQAVEAFFDPFLKVVDASRSEEARDAIIGLDTHWNLLFVVHIEIQDDEIRIISARKATRRERFDYEN